MGGCLRSISLAVGRHLNVFLFAYSIFFTVHIAALELGLFILSLCFSTDEHSSTTQHSTKTRVLFPFPVNIYSCRLLLFIDQ